MRSSDGAPRDLFFKEFVAIDLGWWRSASLARLVAADVTCPCSDISVLSKRKPLVEFELSEQRP